MRYARKLGFRKSASMDYGIVLHRWRITWTTRKRSAWRIGGWSDPKILHEIYTHLSAKNLNMKKDKMYEFYKNLEEGEEAAPAEA